MPRKLRPTTSLYLWELPLFLGHPIFFSFTVLRNGCQLNFMILSFDSDILPQLVDFS